MVLAGAGVAVEAAAAGRAAGCGGWDDFLLDFPFAPCGPLFPVAPVSAPATLGAWIWAPLCSWLCALPPPFPWP